MTQDNRIPEVSPKEDPVLKMWQKPEVLTQTNDSLLFKSLL